MHERNIINNIGSEIDNCREQMLRLREELLIAEEDRMAGRTGCTLEELDAYLDDIIIRE